MAEDSTNISMSFRGGSAHPWSMPNDAVNNQERTYEGCGERQQDVNERPVNFCYSKEPDLADIVVGVV